MDNIAFFQFLGDVISDDPGEAFVNQLTHLQGSKDSFPGISNILYPGRWRIVKHSAWNQAKRDGKITFVDPGPMKHTGRGDYFDRKEKLPIGQSYLEKTMSVIATALIDQENQTAV